MSERRLASWVSVEVPGAYWLDMVFEDGEWRPAEPIPAPRHHAVRLELDNEAEFPSLVERRARRVRFTVQLTSRDLRQVPNRHEWRATYRARIVRAD